MYTTSIFETAITICGYELFHLYKSKGMVASAQGSIPVIKKVSINGIRRKVNRTRRVRWNDIGQCFSRYSNKRLRKYDLPLRTVYEDNQRKEVQQCM